MTEESHLPCPNCESSDAFSYNKTKGVGFCHSCRTPYKDEGIVVDPRKAEYTYESFRGISKETRQFYDSPVGYIGEVPVAVRYPIQDSPDKYRVLPKDFSHNKGVKQDTLFAMDKFPKSSATVLTITEGEEDAMAAWEMLGGKWPVVSLPNASLNKKLLRKCHEYIDSFDQIAVAVDADKPGDNVAMQLAAAFPNKVYRVKLGLFKDANDYLLNNKRTEFKMAWTSRQKYVPELTYNTPEQFVSILRDPEVHAYIPTPIEEFNRVCKGLLQGHLTILTGQEGLGKTEVLRLMEYNILANHPDTPIAVLHMEESKKTNLLTLASYALGTNVRNTDHEVEQEEIETAITTLTEKENLYLFEMSVDDDPLNIVDRCRYYAKVCGCKYIFIDPIQQLAYGNTSDLTDEQTLTRISVQLERICVEYNVGIIMTAHVNDDGQTRSSRMIGKSASVRVMIERDHMSPDEEVRNTTFLTCTKNRPFGTTGPCGQLKFDPLSFTLEENLV